jgi:hypothetical protein
MTRFTKPGGQPYSDKYERWNAGDSPGAAEDLRLQLEIARTMRAMLARETSLPEPSSPLPKTEERPVQGKSVNCISTIDEMVSNALPHPKGSNAK